MIRRDFFAHENPDGERAFERAQKMGFVGFIGENLAISSSLKNAHLSLERSAAHLQNSVQVEWTRVGFGIKLNDKNQYYVTVLFSTRDFSFNPLTPQ